MGEVLRCIETGQPITSVQIEDLISNRAAKYRARRRIIATNVIETLPQEETSRNASIELRSRLSRCNQRERAILVAVGGGASTKELCRTFAAPAGTVKTWVRRARLKFAA
jgi:DNA-directed RNA polymerase specialized sigma24 family protein